MKKLMIIVVTLLAACTNADRAQISGYGNSFKVTLYASTGAAIREWVSDGKVMTEDKSDGWYFMDSKTHKLVRVSGPVVVEQLD
jgi:hypothetical protein